MMRILVTGGAGFLGSHLCEFLLDKGHDVICMDNLITGDASNVSHLEGKKGFTLLNQSVYAHISIDGHLDAVMHFASPASPIDYQKIPIQTLKAGSHGTHNCLGLALAKKARFLLASTSEVYGDPLIHPQPESYWGNVNPVGFRGCYDEAKRYAEALTMAYHRIHGIDTKIVRIFNTYGPRMRIDDGRAIPAFLSQALKGESLTVFGDGSQTRSFCYVSDLIDGIYKLLMSDINDPVNIGNPNEFTIMELADKVLEVTGSGSQTIKKPLPKDDPKIRQPDITKAKDLLGWEPKIALEEGLKLSLPWFKEKVLKH